MSETQGTYLVWLDFNGTGLDPKQIDDIICNKAKLWLDSGRIFGDSGAGFERINVACILNMSKKKYCKATVCYQFN